MKATKKSALAFVALAALLTGCAQGAAPEGTDPATPPPPAADVCEGVTLNYIGLEGEEGAVELEQWRAERNMTLASSWPGNWADLIAAISVGQPYELSTIPYHWAQRMIAAGIVQPIDTTRLSNWDKIAEGLRENKSLRGEDGQVYGVPLAWGDKPFIYVPDRVSEVPTSILDLLEPQWKGRYVLFDAPEFHFHLLAKAAGYNDSPLLTPEQLDAVVEKAQILVDNAAAFNSNYQDANDRMLSGDVDLAIGGWEAQVVWAQEKGEVLAFDFFTEAKSGWWDGIAIPATSTNVDCAYEYIDALISAETQAQIGVNLASGVVNLDAVPLLPEVDRHMYNYQVIIDAKDDDFAVTVPPETAPDGYVGFQAWLDAWQKIKS